MGPSAEQPDRNNNRRPPDGDLPNPSQGPLNQNSAIINDAMRQLTRAARVMLERIYVLPVTLGRARLVEWCEPNTQCSASNAADSGSSSAQQGVVPFLGFERQSIWAGVVTQTAQGLKTVARKFSEPIPIASLTLAVQGLERSERLSEELVCAVINGFLHGCPGQQHSSGQTHESKARSALGSHFDGVISQRQLDIDYLLFEAFARKITVDSNDVARWITAGTIAPSPLIKHEVMGDLDRIIGIRPPQQPQYDELVKLGLRNFLSRWTATAQLGLRLISNHGEARIVESYIRAGRDYFTQAAPALFGAQTELLAGIQELLNTQSWDPPDVRTLLGIRKSVLRAHGHLRTRSTADEDAASTAFVIAMEFSAIVKKLSEFESAMTATWHSLLDLRRVTFSATDEDERTSKLLTRVITLIESELEYFNSARRFYLGDLFHPIPNPSSRLPGL